MAEESAPTAAAPRVDAKKLMQTYEALVAKRLPWTLLWQDIAQYVVPRRYPGMAGTVMAVGTEVENRLFDTTAIHAHQVNAAGCLSWMTPSDSPWFAYALPSQMRDENAKHYLARCSQTAREQLARSPFYAAAHEFFLDRSAFGTGCIYAERDEEGELHFECWSVGTFVIAESHRGKVDTVIREFKLNANQALEKFGKDNLSGKILKALAKGGSAALEEFRFLHFIMPRPKSQRAEGTPQQRMPWACYYVEADSKHVCRENGYPKLPVFVSRYLEWGTGSGGCYGWAPAFSALPECRQLNFIQKNMDALSELMAFPPWLVPEELENEVDGNAGGVTYFSKDITTDRMPRQLENRGRYDIGKDRVLERQNAVNRAFNVDLFQMFASMEKPGQMTAREVAERSAEKLIPFSPTFARVSSEVCTPLVEWLFDDLLMTGAFGPPEAIPASLKMEQEGGFFVQPPTVQFVSRMALEMRRLPMVGLWRTLEFCDAVTKGKGGDASIFDNFDWDKGARAGAVTDGVDADVVVPMNKVDELRKARAEAQMQQEQIAQMQAAADAAGKIGGIQTDSVVGQQLAAA